MEGTTGKRHPFTVAAMGLLVSAALLTKANAAAEEMAFRYVPNTKLEYVADFDFRSIYAKGAITSGTASRFARFLVAQAIAPGATVYLDSPGGNVAEGIELGMLIRKHGLNTYVSANKSSQADGGIPHGCFSACTFAFLGGVSRSVAPGALFGVHQVATDLSLTPTDALSQGQDITGTLAEYVALMGVKSEFVFAMTRSTSGNILLLTESDLRAMNAVTEQFHTEWGIEPQAGSFYLVAATVQNGGRDAVVFSCTPYDPIMVFIWNASGKIRSDTLDFTTAYGLDFDDRHIELSPDEAIEKVSPYDAEHITVVVRISTRILRELRASETMTFEMMPRSRISYAGWTTDIAKGRDQLFEFLKTCSAQRPSVASAGQKGGPLSVGNDNFTAESSEAQPMNQSNSSPTVSDAFGVAPLDACTTQERRFAQMAKHEGFQYHGPCH